MEAAYRKEADCMIVPMPREVDHHVAGNMSREIDLLAESWHVHRIVFDFAYPAASRPTTNKTAQLPQFLANGQVCIKNPPPAYRRRIKSFMMTQNVSRI